METNVESAVVPAVLNSLMLLNRTNLRGVSSWVPRTVQALSIAAHHRNRVVGSGLMAALYVQRCVVFTPHAPSNHVPLGSAKPVSMLSTTNAPSGAGAADILIG